MFRHGGDLGVDVGGKDLVPVSFSLVACDKFVDMLMCGIKVLLRSSRLKFCSVTFEMILFQP